MKQRWQFAAAGLVLAAAPLFGTTYSVTTTADSGAGSLRQAILDANGSAGSDVINFNIVGSGVHTISPLTPLPSITEAVTINGYSQPGASANTNAPNQGSNAVIRIEIDGHNLGFGQNAFTLAAATTIRGLAINRANNAGVFCGAGSNASIIAGNFIGTDAAGASLPGAQYAGVQIFGASAVVVGGSTPADRNVIAGNGGANVLMGDGAANNTVIKGNLIGLNAAGTAALAAGSPYGGIYVRIGTGIQIGGPTAAERNVISGHPQSGVVIGYTVGGTAAQGTIEGNFIGTDVTGTLKIPNNNGVFIPNSNCIVRNNVISGNNAAGIFSDGGANHVIQGNFIGTDASATLNLGNAGGGIVVGGAGWTIGGTGAGEGNVIAHNGATQYGGIVNGGYQFTRMRRNRIFDNAHLGIDLYPAGVTPNDDGDADSGANGLQNYPIITSAVAALGDAAGTHIIGALNSAASTTYQIDFFSNPGCANRPQEYLQGQDYIGSTQVTTDGSGNASIDVVVDATPAGARITATATDPNGNTSEFAQRLIFSVTPTSGPANGGTNFTITGMLFANGITVTVGGQPATNVNVVNPTTIVAMSPALPAGSLNNIVVSNTDLTGGTLVNGWVADFSDVPTAQQFHFYIAKLVANGITVGCGVGTYCPLNPVLRQQMAAFLMKSRNGLCYTPPPCVGTFQDVPCSNPFASWVEALAQSGITGGCGGPNYCPGNPVTRQQMAVFLLRAKHGSNYHPPQCNGDFADVACPGNPYADWIEQLAAENITAGCGSGNFCPTQSVRRDQMAAFLYNTFQFP